MIDSNVPSTPSTKQSLDQQLQAVCKRLLTNLCNCCGATPTTKNDIGVIGRLVFSVCGHCMATDSFTIRQPEELMVSPEVARILSGGGSFDIHPSALLRSPELSLSLFGESFLRDMPTAGGVQ